MTQPQPERREPIMDEDDNFARELELYTREWRNKVARLLRVLEAVVEAGRPHGRSHLGNPCDCERCLAYDAAKAALKGAA